MEKERSTAESVARAVKIVASLLAVGSVFAVLGGLGIYAVLSLVFDKTTVSVTDLPGAFSAFVTEGTAELPVARVFASYIPTFAGIFLSIFFFFQLRKTAKGIEEHNGRLFYPGSHKELVKLAAIALITNTVQYMIYFGLKTVLSAENLPKDFSNILLFLSFVLFILAFVSRKREKLQEKSEPSVHDMSDENTVCGDSSPEKEYQQ